MNYVEDVGKARNTWEAVLGYSALHLYHSPKQGNRIRDGYDAHREKVFHSQLQAGLDGEGLMALAAPYLVQAALGILMALRLALALR